jgi:hypothetical protein
MDRGAETLTERRRRLTFTMSDALSEHKRQRVRALGRLGGPLRRVEHETAVRRETARAYLGAAGITARRVGRPEGGRPRAKLAIAL